MGITTAALAELSGLSVNVGSKTAFTYIALGTSDTAFASSQTTLVAETAVSGLARVQVTPTQETTTETDDTAQLEKQFTAGATATIKEVGIFNASSAGTMLARKVTASAHALENGNTLTITYQVIYS